jgi:osmotically-inducible protein OsmY
MRASGRHQREATRPRHRVTADVDDGVVTLHGIVERAYQRSQAEAIVRHVPGVTAVKNEISVRDTEELRETGLHH